MQLNQWLIWVKVYRNTIFGIYWENNSNVVDLDLSLISKSGKVGWDGTTSGDIMFSGDIVNAEDGATESIYVKKFIDEPKLIFVNDYTSVASKNNVVNSRVFLGFDSNIKNLPLGYTLNPNNVL